MNHLTCFENILFFINDPFLSIYTVLYGTMILICESNFGILSKRITLNSIKNV